MPASNSSSHSELKTPKAAAIAGIVFSVLLIAIIFLFRSAVPASPLEPGAWLTSDIGAVSFALNLFPFAGIAFLWFIGVLRDRLGAREDRFFATVFFGSALLYIAILFTAAGLIGALVVVVNSSDPELLANSPTFRLARAAIFVLLNVYATKMATVFMISTSTVVIYTDIAPRWTAIVGYGLAMVLLVGSYYSTWPIVVLPLWVLLLSVIILIDNMRSAPAV